MPSGRRKFQPAETQRPLNLEVEGAVSTSPWNPSQGIPHDTTADISIGVGMRDQPAGALLGTVVVMPQAYSEEIGNEPPERGVTTSFTNSWPEFADKHMTSTFRDMFNIDTIMWFAFMGIAGLIFYHEAPAALLTDIDKWLPILSKILVFLVLFLLVRIPIELNRDLTRKQKAGHVVKLVCCACVVSALVYWGVPLSAQKTTGETHSSSSP